jgi:hypothetical protein
MLVSISRTAGKCLIGVEGGDVAVLVTVLHLHVGSEWFSVQSHHTVHRSRCKHAHAG